MNYLIEKQNVDAIYWFADFQDKCDNHYFEPFINLAKRKKVRIYIHCPENSGAKALKKQAEDFKELVESTGGDFIAKKIE